MEKKIKFLSIVPFPLFPLQSGGQNKTYGLLKALAKQNDLTVVSPVSASFKIKVPFVFFGSLLSPAFYRYFNIFSLPRLLKEAKKCDVITIEQPFFGLMALIIRWFVKKPLVVNAHNIEYQRFKTLGTWWWLLLKKYEALVLKKVDAVFFISELDRQGAIKEFRLPKEKCFVSPYGVNKKDNIIGDTVALKEKLDIPASNSLFLFFGKMDYAPNRIAVENIQKYVMPALLAKGFSQFSVLICGKGLPKGFIKQSEKEHIQYLGFVEDLEAMIANCDVVLNPVISGGGVKTKVLEAIALHRTVVSTSDGALGIDESVCGEKLLVAKNTDWAVFVELCLKAKTASQKDTPSAFFEKYSWQGIAKQYDEDLSSLF